MSDLGEAKGKQELFTRQAPQKLKVFLKLALISASQSGYGSKGPAGHAKRKSRGVPGAWPGGLMAKGITLKRG